LHISHSILGSAQDRSSDLFYFEIRRGLNLTRGSLFQFVLPNGFIQTARANDLPSRQETLRQLVTKRPSS